MKIKKLNQKILKKILAVLLLTFCFAFISFVSAAGQTITDSNGVIITTDELGRTVYMEYPGADGEPGRVLELDYYGISGGIKIININHGEETQIYDRNGNLRYDRFPGHPEKDFVYKYWPNKEKIIKNGVSITFIYSNTSKVLRQLQEIPAKGVIIVTDLSYDSKDRLSVLRTPKIKYNYTYYDYPEVLKDQLDTVYITQYSPDGTFVNSYLRYYYDLKGNIVARADDVGAIINYTYNDFSYPCQKIQCNDLSDPNCLDYTLVPITCSYSQLNTRSIGNYVTKENYDSNGNPVSLGLLDNSGAVVKNYQPTKIIDSSLNLLEKDQEYSYTYGGKNQLTEIKTTDTGGTANVYYTSDGLLDRLVYSDAEKEKFYSDPFGNQIFEEYTVAGTSLSTTYTTGAVIKNFFFNIFATLTGHVISGHAIDTGIIENNDGTITYSYIASDSSGGDYVALNNYNTLLDNYENTYGPIPQEPQETNICEDFDNGVDIFNASFVSYQDNFYVDNCTSENTLQEYYCGGFFTRSTRSSSHNCQYGCISGACLTEPLVGYNQTIPIVTYNCSSELPPEPGKIGAAGQNYCYNQVTNQSELPPEPKNLTKI